MYAASSLGGTANVRSISSHAGGSRESLRPAPTFMYPSTASNAIAALLVSFDGADIRLVGGRARATLALHHLGVACTFCRSSDELVKQRPFAVGARVRGEHAALVVRRPPEIDDAVRNERAPLVVGRGCPRVDKLGGARRRRREPRKVVAHPTLEALALVALQ